VSGSDITAWLALALIPLTAAIGRAIRRWGSGAFALRMRPHYVLGYLALLGALYHTMGAMSATGGANSNGLWFASLATLGLGAQALLGTNLQAPGTYRRPLRRWHMILFWLTAALALAHVVLNGPFLS